MINTAGPPVTSCRYITAPPNRSKPAMAPTIGQGLGSTRW